MTDDDIEEYLDPELDPVGGGDPLPGPLSVAQLVVGVHLLGAVALTPFLWTAYQQGNTGQMTTLGGLIVAIVVAAAVAGRLAARQYD